jgi:NADH-dependent butanol dehydrogenase
MYSYYLNYNPCKVYFGSNIIKYLPDEILNYGKKVLLTYGKKSIKENGIYSQIKSILKKYNIEIFEYGSITSNPTVDMVEKGAEECRLHSIEIILAVGGGSVIDCSKAIAAVANNDRTIVEIIEDNELITDPIPVISFLTIFGAGSEMDGICSISNPSIPNKRGITHEKLIPKVAFINPEYCSTVPVKYLAYGVVDVITHLLEQYFQDTVQIEAQNSIIEAMLKKCFYYGKRIVYDPTDTEAGINLMYISSGAMNGVLYKSKNEDWSLHPIEHQLSAYYNITHGMGLGILLPEWLKMIFKPKSYKKFYEYGVNVWDMNPELDEIQVGKAAIDKTISFLNFLKIPTSLRSVDIKEKTYFDVMASKAYRSHISTDYLKLSVKEIKELYEKVY